jgi:hydroxymethylbilane synthase
MLPIALRCDGRRALIIGGGDVALRKAEALIAAGLSVYAVAPEFDLRLRTLLELAGGKCIERRYEAADLAGVDLVIAATDDPSVNAGVVDDARRAHVLACDASAPDRGDFTMQATVRVGELTFAIDSGRSTPAFAKRVAREVAQRFDSSYADAARCLARMRTYVRTVLDPNDRAPVLRELAELPIESLAAMDTSQAKDQADAVILRHRANAAALHVTSLVCASRSSALAMTQSRSVAARLAEHGIASSILALSTTGDRVQDRPVGAIGSINVWVKELETALRERRADYAVHSCKDLPSSLEADLRLAAVSRREDPRDAFCSEAFSRFEYLPEGAVVGTSSLRRRAQLQARRPDLRYEDLRGNVDTRLRKLREGRYDAVVLAMAGLNRLGTHATHTVAFSIEAMVPAVGQGALALETRADDEALAQTLRDAVNDAPTERCVTAERAALHALRAGCGAPIGIHAQTRKERMTLDGAYALPNGVVLRERCEASVHTLEDAVLLGQRLARAFAAALPKELQPR